MNYKKEIHEIIHELMTNWSKHRSWIKRIGRSSVNAGVKNKCLYVTHMAQMIKSLSAMQETQVRSLGWESPLEGNGNPLQYSCLENPMDGGGWQAIIHGVSKSMTRWTDFIFTFFYFMLQMCFFIFYIFLYKRKIILCC